MTPSDQNYFKFVNAIFTAPAMFFLAVLLFVLTAYSLIHAGQNVSYIVLGCLLFILGYNAGRMGWKLRG